MGLEAQFSLLALLLAHDRVQCLAGELDGLLWERRPNLVHNATNRSPGGSCCLVDHPQCFSRMDGEILVRQGSEFGLERLRESLGINDGVPGTE